MTRVSRGMQSGKSGYKMKFRSREVCEKAGQVALSLPNGQGHTDGGAVSGLAPCNPVEVKEVLNISRAERQKLRYQSKMGPFRPRTARKVGGF